MFLADVFRIAKLLYGLAGVPAVLIDGADDIIASTPGSLVIFQSHAHLLARYSICVTIIILYSTVVRK